MVNNSILLVANRDVKFVTENHEVVEEGSQFLHLLHRFLENTNSGDV